MKKNDVLKKVKEIFELSSLKEAEAFGDKLKILRDSLLDDLVVSQKMKKVKNSDGSYKKNEDGTSVLVPVEGKFESDKAEFGGFVLQKVIKNPRKTRNPRTGEEKMSDKKEVVKVTISKK